MYRVPYGKGMLQFSLPYGMRAARATSKPSRPSTDVQAALTEALEHPGQRVCIVFTDSTRACPDDLLVPPVLSELKAGGVRDKDITLLCGIGMHRPSTHAEKIAKLGADIVSRYRVIDSEPQNPDALVDLGKTDSGVPISIHRTAVESDLVIATGIVEPHQYAGYSGGFKTLAVGAAGEALITHTHGPFFLDHEGTRLGRIEGNPFQEAVREAASRVGLQFIVNVVLDDDKRLLRIAAGRPDETFGELVRFARSVYEVSIPCQYDIVIGGAGFPKDSNLYQASRVASYLFFAPTCIIRPGGYIIIPAPCEEGAGSGTGEQRFYSAMREAPDVHTILEDARRNGYPAGQQRAFVLAKVLEKSRVIVVASKCPDVVAACKMIPAESMDEALRIAAGELGLSCEVLIVPHALVTLPVVREQSPMRPGRTQ
jgi:nickel-dependent lactate racemase